MSCVIISHCFQLFQAKIKFIDFAAVEGHKELQERDITTEKMFKPKTLKEKDKIIAADES